MNNNSQFANQNVHQRILFIAKLDYAEEELLLSMLIANREEPITFNHIEKTIELCS